MGCPFDATDSKSILSKDDLTLDNLYTAASINAKLGYKAGNSESSSLGKVDFIVNHEQQQFRMEGIVADWSQGPHDELRDSFFAERWHTKVPTQYLALQVNVPPSFVESFEHKYVHSLSHTLEQLRGSICALIFGKPWLQCQQSLSSGTVFTTRRTQQNNAFTKMKA